MKNDPFAKTLETKSESERLIFLINEFLEVQIQKKDLLANPQWIPFYRKLLENNLPSGDIEVNWSRELDAIERERNRSKYIDSAAYMISSIHHLLKSLWSDYKEIVPTLYNIPKSMDAERHLRGLGLLNELEEKWEPELTGHVMTGQELIEYLKLSEKEKAIDEIIDDNTDDYHDEIGVFNGFIALLRRVGPENLRKCESKDCNNWFVWNSKLKKEKKYCTHECGARNYATNKRDKNPKAYNKSMRKYRAKQKKEAKNSSKGTAKSGKT